MVLRPALASLGGLEPGSREFNRWVGLLFYAPALVGSALGLLGGWLTDLLGRRRVLVWSILLYAFASLAASYATTLPQLLVWRCAAVAGVSVEYVAAVAWLAELFSDPRQRQTALGYSQSAAGLGGLMATSAYYFAVTYAERLPPIHGGHDAWRYALLFGLLPAVPLIVVRPFLPESPTWKAGRAQGRGQRPSLALLFRPPLRQTTVVTTVLFACTYGIVSGVFLQTPRMVPGLPEVHGLPARQIEQTVGRLRGWSSSPSSISSQRRTASLCSPRGSSWPRSSSTCR
jgi:MFS family permease